jgi:hypothetical protein
MTERALSFINSTRLMIMAVPPTPVVLDRIPAGINPSLRLRLA